MSSMRDLDAVANELVSIRENNISSNRKKSLEGNIIMRLQQMLKPTIRKMSKRKGMIEHLEEMEQVSLIAIHQASQTWNPKLSTFSTYVHWQLRAEFRSLELTLFPQRRKVCKDINVKIWSINAPKNSDNEKENGESFICDPCSVENPEYSAEALMAKQTIETAFARHMAKIVRKAYKNIENKKTIVTAMRNIDIYRKKEIDDYPSEQLASVHNVTRERIRQVTSDVEKILKRNLADMQKNSSIRTKEENQLWLDAVAIYKDETGIDIRISREEAIDTVWGNDLPQMYKLPRIEEIDSRRAMYRKGMKFEKMNFKAPKRYINTREKDLATIRISEEIKSNKIREEKRKKRLKDARKSREVERAKKSEPKRSNVTASICGLAAAITLNMPVQVAAQSRAIPPKEQNENEIKFPGKILKVDDERTWLVKLSDKLEYDNYINTALRLQEQNRELQGLSLIQIPRDKGKTIAFGPLDKRGANRICRLLKMREQDCLMVRLSSKAILLS